MTLPPSPIVLGASSHVFALTAGLALPINPLVGGVLCLVSAVVFAIAMRSR